MPTVNVAASIVVAAVPAVSVCCRTNSELFDIGTVTLVDTVASVTITARAPVPDVARQSRGEQ